MGILKISSALISVYNKNGLDPLLHLLHKHNVKLFSTGGTEAHIKSLNLPVVPIEDVTSYPSIFGGRVKTLHPKVFGGILYRRDNTQDLKECQLYDIPKIDLVIVDLYPFEETVKNGASHDEIIEKVDIGGISLIRAAAKNYKDCLIVSSRNQYSEVLQLFEKKECGSDLDDRKYFATKAFDMSSHYDSTIFTYFNKDFDFPTLKASIQESKALRYGENPHQKGRYFGDLDELFDILNGKELSYNNLVDVDACVRLIDEFEEELKKHGLRTFAIIKHTNACGVATAKTTNEAYSLALECDPVSAFGGVLITNGSIDKETVNRLHSLFFEVLIAPEFTEEALQILKERKNRIILKRKPVDFASKQIKTLLNGFIEQDVDRSIEKEVDLKVVTSKKPSKSEIQSLLFANKIAKHTKSNTIVIARDNQLLASGVGQTSRVDALRQAIEKAKTFGFELKGSVMASDAFFPFSDCVEIAHKAGITSVLQPGGSIKDKDSIEYCDANGLSMVFTGVRHFLH